MLSLVSFYSDVKSAVIPPFKTRLLYSCTILDSFYGSCTLLGDKCVLWGLGGGGGMLGAVHFAKDFKYFFTVIIIHSWLARCV